MAERLHILGEEHSHFIDTTSLASAMTKVDQADWTPNETAAVEAFANRYVKPYRKLPENEELVAAVSLLKQRFCDFPEPAVGRTSVQAYTLKGSEPPTARPTISLPSQPPGSPLMMAAQQAFSVWSAAAPALVPTFTTGGPADITVNVAPLSDPSKLGSSSTDGKSITVIPRVANGRNIVAVLTHEFGHSLGLLHATTPGSVMYPFDANVVTLTDDDTSAIRTLYGWSQQRRASRRGTDCGPALCSTGSDLAMAWKGVDGDTRIWFASSGDGVNWSDQQAVPLAGTSDSPALAYDSKTRLLHMAWKGIPGDSNLYTSYTWDLRNWGPVVPVPNIGTSHGPALTMTYRMFTPDRLVMAWKGADDDQNLYYSQMGAKGWDAQQRIGGAGTADRPALCTDIGGGARMVWRGVDGDELLYTSVLQDIFWQPQQIVQWVVPGNGPTGTVDVAHALSAFGPAVCSRRPAETFVDEPPPAPPKVFLAWHGAGDDSGLYFTQFARDLIRDKPVDAWSSQAHARGVASSHRPALALFNGQLRMAWKGAENDKGIYLSDL